MNKVNIDYLPLKLRPRIFDEIEGIPFTDREIDVIAGLLNLKVHSKIAQWLRISDNRNNDIPWPYISVKTVETHAKRISDKVRNHPYRNIQTFVEQTGTFDAFRKHYQHLLLEDEFLKKLEKFRTLIIGQNYQCKISLDEEIKHVTGFRESIVNHLEYAGISLASNHQNIQTKLITITSNNDTETSISLITQASYYHMIFAILSKITDDPKSLTIFADFNLQFQRLKNGLTPIIVEKIDGIKLESAKNLFLRKFIILFLFITAVLVSCIALWRHHETPINIVYSDLILPEKAFLERPQIIKQMQEKLDKKDSINTIALIGIIGIGGVGKTTMARYYGKYVSKATIVWELNAQTKETLINSFWDLAYSLTEHLDNNELLRRNLSEIKQCQDIHQREKLLLNFVMKQLHDRPGWLLIYDNIEDFGNIEHLFPQNQAQWGSGNIIITTRNNHILNTGFLNSTSVIHMDALSLCESSTLFAKIIYEKDFSDLTSAQQNDVLEFLNHVPHFPLEISLAAYYIKEMQVTFAQYLEHINDFSQRYDEKHANLLKEATKYSKTRYAIVSSSIDKIIQINHKFKELFFLIFSLDSQNIPHRLLEEYSSTDDAAEFVFYLQKNGLLIRESSIYSNNNESKTISIHRATQAMGNAFLMNSLSEKERISLTRKSIVCMKTFYQNCLEKRDKKTIIELIPHLNMMISNINNMGFSSTIKNGFEAELYFLLGVINEKQIGNFLEAKKLLLEALSKDEKSKNFSIEKTANIYRTIAKLCIPTHNLKDALKYSAISIKLAQKIKNSEYIIADNLQAMCSVYKRTDNFIAARTTCEDAINILMQGQHVDKNVLAEIYLQLADLYLINYMHKKEAKIAKYYHTKMLEVLNINTFTDDLEKVMPRSCFCARYLSAYATSIDCHDNNYIESRKLYDIAYNIIMDQCPENIYLRGRTLGHLGEKILYENDVKYADMTLTNAIELISIALGTNLTWFYKIPRAEARIRLGKFQLAYEDVANIGTLSVEKSPLYNLRYLTSFYHAAFAKYKLGDYNKSLEHFADFMKLIDDFCKSFLETEEYEKLVKQGVFKILEVSDQDTKNTVKTYLHNSVIIFTAIYYPEHTFVKDYIAKNYEDETNESLWKMILSNLNYDLF